MQYDIVIIGAGPAGMTAAIYAKRANMNIIILDKLAPGGQILNTNEIRNYTGAGTINGADLAIKMLEHTMELGVEMDYATVTGIKDENGIKRILCEEEDKEFTGRAVIIATGTKARSLHIPGEEKYAGTGISWCAICDGPAYRDKDVVVIGGGNSAAEESLYLTGMVHKLSIVTMLDLTADPVVCQSLRENEKVTIFPYQEVLEFYGEDKKIKGVRFKSAKTGQENTVACDGVFEYIGQAPMTEPFRNLGIVNSYGYIKADGSMSTAQSGIFAAGDCIEKHLRQVITACSDGAIAAQEAAKFVKANRRQ